MNRYLHIVNGATTQRGVEEAGIGGEISEFADVLHEGPVPPDDDMEEWLSVRAQFIASCGWALFDEALATARQWHAALTAYRDYDEVVLWYEHDLFDQLLLIRHLNWWRRVAADRRLSLVSPADYLGPMTGAQLRAFFDERSLVTEAQISLASSAWRAFTAPDPRQLAAMVRDVEMSALPHLHGALVRLLQEYPSPHNGLGRTEQQVLEIIDQSPLTIVELFSANARREERVFMGDTTFLLRLRGLMSGPHPLLQQKVDDAPLHITDQGRRVLAGEADAVALNGIDRWIGGVHLTTDFTPRWNGEEIAIAEAT